MSNYSDFSNGSAANGWYARKGFVCEGEESTRTGRRLRLWRLCLC